MDFDKFVILCITCFVAFCTAVLCAMKIHENYVLSHAEDPVALACSMQPQKANALCIAHEQRFTPAHLQPLDFSQD